MNRRSFLTLAGLGAAGMVMDPERLLWVPGQKAIFDLGPSTHVMVGGWVQDETRFLYQRFLFTRTADGRMYGGSIYVTPKDRRDVSWPQVERQVTNRAIRDLDAAARHRRATAV